MKKSNAKYALAAFIATIVFVIIYKYTLNELYDDSLKDLVEHTFHAENIYLNTLWQSWLERPYLFWHLCVKGCIKFLKMPVDEASAFICSFLALCNYFITFYLLDRTASQYAKREAGIMAACAAGMLELVQPLYVRWFNSYQYEGQFSINPIFNPTHMAVKPFGLLCFMLAVDLIRIYRGEDRLYFPGTYSPRRFFFALSVVLLLSAFTKPTFMFMFLPAGALFLLIELALSLWRKDESYKKLWDFIWKTALACVPSLSYLIFQYTAFYVWGGTDKDAHITIYPFMTAWRLFSPNIPKSIVLSMSFPFLIVLTNWKYFLHSVEGKLGIIGYVTGTLEFSFIVETGSKLGHLNFAWCMMSGMELIWVVSAAYLIHLTSLEESGRREKIVIIAGWLLLSIHLFSGLYYINPFMYII